MTELVEENRSSPEMFSDTPRRDKNMDPSVTNDTFRENTADGFRNELADTMASLTDITLEDAVNKIKEIEQANLLLRDYLRKNNQEVKKQYETLMLFKRKDKEKFDQTKAVITALRKENEEMQVKLLEKDETVNELEVSLRTAQEQISSFQQERINARLKEASQDVDVTDDVYDPFKNHEYMIAELKNTITTKEDCIALLQDDLSKHKKETKTYQESAQQLLKDLESQQALKVATDEENRVLNQELVELKNKLHEQMHIQLNSTKRELQAQHGKKTTDPALEATPEEHLSSQLLLTPESIDVLVERAQSLEEAKYDDAEKLKSLLENETLEKQQLEQKIQELSEKVKELNQQNNEAVQKIVAIEKEKSEQINQLCQDYEAKLTEKTKENLEKKQREPANTEDTGVLRSQILSLIKEVQEAECKNSDLTRTIHHKDDRLKMLTDSLDESEKQRLALTNENIDFRQHLNAQINAQRQAHEVNMTLQQSNRQLQISLDKIFADYRDSMNLVESYKSEMMQMQQDKVRAEERRQSSENMEELNRLAAEVIAAEEALSLKDDQLTEIKGRYNHLEEEAGLLRIQAETYKSDFSCERDARTKLAQEKAELMEALHKCQEENLEYKDELREINQQQFRELQGRVQRRSQEASPPNYGFAEQQQGGAEAGPRFNDMGLNSGGSGPPTSGPRIGDVSSRNPYGSPFSQASTSPQTMGTSSVPRAMGAGSLPRPMSAGSLPRSMGAGSLPRAMGAGTLPRAMGGRYGLASPGQTAGQYPNMSVSTLTPRRAYDMVPGVTYHPPWYQPQEQEQIRLSEEEVGDGGLVSLEQFGCPSCGLLFPDIDTLNLHVPDCIDGK